MPNAEIASEEAFKSGPDYDPEVPLFVSSEVTQVSGIAKATLSSWRTAGLLSVAELDIPEGKRGREIIWQFHQVVGLTLVGMLTRRGIMPKLAAFYAGKSLAVLDAWERDPARKGKLTWMYVITESETEWSGLEFGSDDEATNDWLWKERAEPDNVWLSWIAIDLQATARMVRTKLKRIRELEAIIKAKRMRTTREISEARAAAAQRR